MSDAQMLGWDVPELVHHRACLAAGGDRVRLTIRILGTEVFAVDTEKPDKPAVPTDRDH